MATLTVQQIVLAGITPSFATAAGGGDQFANNGKTYVHIKNGGASPITATFNSQTNCDQGFDHDQAVVVTNGQERVIGPFPTARFNNSSDVVLITYTAVTSVTIGVFSL